ncbi:hypothetical protein [Planctomicrobium sp. SH664]|uniref:hypothetical protein n=1 Tax=Planctomicrobium sp. SH664 TaxID=3448125 RepID=UPI003F5C3E5B
MIEQLLVIGETTGMEQVVSHAMRSARAVRGFASLAELFAASVPADVLLVCQHSPDEYSPADILDVLEMYPLARIIVVQGIWCQSYGRTRQGWPAAVCVRGEEAIGRIEKELQVLKGDREPLPWTAALDEIFAFDHGT